MNRISKHVAYSEITQSYTAKRNGIENIPNEDQLSRIKDLAENIFEPIREHFNVPIYISSCFRSPELNILIGGATHSQHMANNGAAMDLDADRYGNITNCDIFTYIKDSLNYDQCIWEFGTDENPDWVHVSYNEGKNRKQLLRAYKDEQNKTVYKKI
jgi:hypothetical protein